MQTQHLNPVWLLDFMYSFSKHLLSTYYVPGTVLSIWDNSVNKDKIPGISGLVF